MTTDDGETEYYTGLTSTTFKKRYGSHKTSMTNPKYKYKSTHVWKLKSENKKYITKWTEPQIITPQQKIADSFLKKYSI